MKPTAVTVHNNIDMENSQNTPVIVLRNLKKRFGIGDAEQYALDGVDLTINKGEFVTIMGPSGSGKTTLLNVLGLLDTSVEGDYELEGQPVSSLSKRRLARIRSQQIGFVFQSFNLISRLTVIENVALPLTYKGGMSHLKRMKKASEMLATFHLNEREYYLPYQLSGGQTQRVAIARALVNNPSIILADEPTGNLDSRASHIIMEELSDLHRRGNTIIMVTHNPDLTTYASRVITMLDGKIASDTDVLIGKPSVDFKRPMGQKVTVSDPVTSKLAKLNAEPDTKPMTKLAPANRRQLKALGRKRQQIAKKRTPARRAEEYHQ